MGYLEPTHTKQIKGPVKRWTLGCLNEYAYRLPKKNVLESVEELKGHIADFLNSEEGGEKNVTADSLGISTEFNFKVKSGNLHDVANRVGYRDGATQADYQTIKNKLGIDPEPQNFKARPDSARGGEFSIFTATATDLNRNVAQKAFDKAAWVTCTISHNGKNLANLHFNNQEGSTGVIVEEKFGKNEDKDSSYKLLCHLERAYAPAPS